MSTKDINKNRSKNGISKNILFGILAGIIAAIGFTGISNISAQDMTTTTNDTSQMQGKVNLTGTIEVDKTIGDALKSKVNINILDAITTAQNSVGPNATAKEAELTEAHGYLVYKMKIIGEDMKKYKVIVDPGNGQVLMNKEITWYDEHEKMKYGDEKGDKYGHDNKMMMKDKKY
jgi:hypothetical protein